MSQSHTDWNQTCLLQVVPVKAGRAGAMALARQLDDLGLWQLMLVLLTPKGEAIAGSEWLPIESTGNGTGLVITGDRQGLLYVTERESRAGTPRYDVPRWFSVKWRGSKITFREIGRWEDVNLGLKMTGVSTDEGTVWVGECYQDTIADHLDTRVVIARSKGQELPVPQMTEVASSGCSDLVRFDDEFYLVTTPRYERVELYAIDRNLVPRKVLDLETRRNKKVKLGPGPIARCGDTLIAVWGHYQDRVGTKKPRTWEGRIHAASFSPATQTASDVVTLTPDSRVVATTIEAHGFGDSAVITWESRPKRGGGGMRAARVSSVDEMPRDPVVLPDKDGPLFLLDEAGPFLRWGWMPDSSSWAVPDSELLS